LTRLATAGVIKLLTYQSAKIWPFSRHKINFGQTMRKLKQQVQTFALATTLSLSAFSSHAAREPVDKIAAVVNEDVVLQSELIAAVANISKQLSSQGQQLPPATTLRSQVLERLITAKVQEQRAERIGIRIDEAELTAAVKSIAERNGLSLREFASALRADEIDYLEFRNSIRSEMIMNRLRQSEVERKVVVTEREVDDAMGAFIKQSEQNKSYRLQHIMVGLPEAADGNVLAERQAKIDGVLQQLSNGGDFSDLAIANSDGQFALEGGNLGWRKIDEVPQLFADAVKSLESGQHSQVIRSGGGFHIIKIAETKGEERHFTNEALARHILISVNDKRSDAEAKERTNEIMRKLYAGEDFASLAKEFSDDPGSGAKGGDLGWTDPVAFVPKFSEAVKSQELATIGQSVKTQFGYHLIEVLDRRQVDTTELEQRSQVRRAIGERKMAEESTLWQQRLRDEAYVDLRI
jgi:peptidyl-prolyl cis-trans isomerase SurA